MNIVLVHGGLVPYLYQSSVRPITGKIRPASSPSRGEPVLDRSQAITRLEEEHLVAREAQR